jgi:(R,R)-butanediol dehydrogenase/meso-butanediol dehydrogenase/diacetyl reductase
MKAAVYRGAGKPLALETLSDPEPGPEDVIVKVHRCGICGTDLHMTEGHQWEFAPGTVPGHEYAGEIVELGSRVSKFKRGDLITALPSTGCGRCEACYRGNLALCHNAPGVMGGYAELMRIPAAVAVKLPSSLSAADGALIEPLAVGLYGTRMSHIRPGDRVLVLGAGSVALCTIYWARRLGAGRIVAMSRAQRRRAMALDMGADAFVEYGASEIGEVTEALGGQPDIVFECVGSPGLLMKGIQHVGDFGQVISMGFCTAPEQLVPALAGFKGVSLQFPVGYSLKDFHYVADVMDAGHVDPRMLISSVITLDDLPTVFERLRLPNSETKVQVAPATQGVTSLSGPKAACAPRV